jgi:type IV secretory pathway VirB4 component
MGGLFFGVSQIVAGNVVGRVYAAVKFPAELDYDWAVELMNGSDCVTSITYYPGSAYELGNALSQSIRQNGVDAAVESDARKRKGYERGVKSADRLLDDLDANNAAIGHIALLVMPYAGDEERLEDVCRNVVSRFAKKRIKLKALGGLQKEGYKHISPYHISQTKIENIARYIMPLKSLMGGSPMTVNILRDDNGKYFARTMDGGMISVDFLLRGGDRLNGNMTATGTSGSGKSTALKSILETLFMLGVKIIVIDPEREYRDLCRNLNGAWLDVGGGKVKSNFLQIRPVPDDEDEEKGKLYEGNGNAVALHIQTLDVMFKLYLPSLTDLQRTLLKRTLVELYEQFHITWETDVSALKAEDFPIAEDLYRMLEEKAKEDPRYRDLADLIYNMAEGADAFLWNGHSNVSLDNNFVVLDTNRLINAGDELKRALYFNNLSMCWEEIARDRDQPVFLLCDEAHILLDPEIREPAMYLRNVSKRARKYEGMLGVVLQSVVDASYEKIRLYGQAILDNSTYKLLFATDGKNLQETADTFQLTEAEQSILLGAPRGRALCLIGHQHVCVDFDIPQYKLDLMGKGGGR